MQPEHKQARLYLSGGDQREAAGLPPELQLCRLHQIGFRSGQDFADSRGIRPVEGCQPAVEQATGLSVRDLAELAPGARQVNDPERMNGAGLASGTFCHGCFARAAEIDGVYAGWVVIVVGTTCSAWMSAVLDVKRCQEDRCGDEEGEQHRSWTEALFGSDVELKARQCIVSENRFVTWRFESCSRTKRVSATRSWIQSRRSPGRCPDADLCR